MTNIYYFVAIVDTFRNKGQSSSSRRIKLRQSNMYISTKDIQFTDKDRITGIHTETERKTPT